MSRSFKKTPYCGDKKGKAKKRIANKKVRMFLKENPEVMTSKKSFRKIYETYDICDFYDIEDFPAYYSWQLKFYLQNVHRWPDMKKPNKKQLYKEWYKSYKMK